MRARRRARAEAAQARGIAQAAHELMRGLNAPRLGRVEHDAN
jgi:hypothetical protein